MKAILYFLVTAGLIWAVATYLGSSLGIQITGENTYISALVFSVVLTLVNLIIGTILRILTLPLNILTLGLFSCVVTLVVVWITDSFYDNIILDNILEYIVIALIPGFSSILLGLKK